MIELSLIQKMKIMWQNHVYVGHETRENWKGDLPFYVFRCPEHGLVKDYPHGYNNRLDCPHCRYSVRIRAKEFDT